MKKWLVAALLFTCGFCDLSVKAHELPKRPEYVIVTSYRVSNDAEWMDVIEALKK